jgi:hypothetical protein
MVRGASFECAWPAGLWRRREIEEAKMAGVWIAKILRLLDLCIAKKYFVITT